MIRSFASEWVKLFRGRQLLSVWGVMAALMVLFTVLILANAGTEEDRAEAAARAARGEQNQGPVILITQLEAAEGLTFGLSIGANLLGVVTLVLFAGNFAGEYTNGTLKVLLSRQPVRLKLLTGKFLAIFTFAAIGTLLAFLAEVVASAAMGSARGFDMTAWWTGDAILDAAGLVGRVAVSMFAWGAIGTVLAILLRSGPAAIGLGIGYVLIAEGLLGLAFPNFVRYLPGQTITAFVQAGNANPIAGAMNPVGFATATLLMGCYVLLFLLTAALVFIRRDVTG